MFIKVYHKVFDYRLSPNALKVYIYLTSVQNCLANAIVKVGTISTACAINSPSTVHAALAELEGKGMLVKYQRRNYEGNYIANGYYVKQLRGDWFPLPKDAEAFALPKASFAAYLLLLKCRNKRNRAFPSFNHMAKVLGLARNTIIAAIQDLVSKMLVWRAAKWAGKHNLYVVYSLAQNKNSAVTTPRCFTENDHQKMNRSISTAILSLPGRIVKGAKQVCSAALSLLQGRVVQKSYSSI